MLRAAAWMLMFMSAGCVHAGISVDFISRIALSPDGELAAIVTSGEGDVESVAVLRVPTRELLLTVQTSDFAKHIDRPSIEGVTWSADSAYLKVDVSDGDLEHRVLIVRPRRHGTLELVAVGKRAAVAAKWSTTGHTLFVIAAGNEPEDYPAGLFVLEPPDGAAKAVVDDRPVTAILDVSAKRLLLKAPYDASRKLPAAVIEILLPSFARKTFLVPME